MKDLNFAKLAMVYAGCFLGAGYVSGQELWQYFGAFGIMGYVGLAAAMLILFLLGLVIMCLSQKTGIYEAEKLTVPWEIKPLRVCFSALEILMMFAIMAIMNAGVGALAEQLFGLPHWIVSAAFGLLVLVCTLAGLQGIVSVFSFSVPCLVAAAVLMCILFLARGGAPDMTVKSGNGLLGNWLMSAVNFACYNIFVTIAIMAPFGQFVKKRSTVYAGIGCGSLSILLIALSVLLSVAAVDGAAEAELPMLFAASTLSPWAAYAYALLLSFAMFGTALSSQVSIVNYFSGKSAGIKKHSRLFTVLLSAAAFGAGLFGFGDLIGVLYPLFGYGSVVFILMMTVHYFRVSGKKAVKA